MPAEAAVSLTGPHRGQVTQGQGFLQLNTGVGMELSVEFRAKILTDCYVLYLK